MGYNHCDDYLPKELSTMKMSVIWNHETISATMVNSVILNHENISSTILVYSIWNIRRRLVVTSIVFCRIINPQMHV